MSEPVSSEDASYYERNSEERRAYQREYYAKNKEVLKRKKEIEAELEPEKVEKTSKYQRDYYYENRNKLLKARKDRRLRRMIGEE